MPVLVSKSCVASARVDLPDAGNPVNSIVAPDLAITDLFESCVDVVVTFYERSPPRVGAERHYICIRRVSTPEPVP